MEEKNQALSILCKAFRNIKSRYPEFVLALNLLKPTAVSIPIKISTDFDKLYYSPEEVIKLNKDGELKELEYQIVHILLHGLLGAPEKAVSERQTKVLWLSEDQRVGMYAERLGFSTTNSDARFYLHQMRDCKPYSVGFGKYHINKKIRAVVKKAKGAQRLIASDEHFMWSDKYIKHICQYIEGDEETKETTKDKSKVIEKWNNVHKAFFGDKNEDEQIENMRKAKGCGRESGGEDMTELVVTYDKNPLDYKKVLREFLTENEKSVENMDSIDPAMYSYSLELYGDVPLIEPREDDEIVSIDTLCIAIDTSGSCSGERARKMLTEVRGIFSDLGLGLGTKDAKVLLLQCDDRIQKEELLSLDDFMNKKNEMELRGWGGTSFVPVFERIDTLIEDEDMKINGLIYLTDGYGEYPEKKASYKTVFVMGEEDDKEYVPEWIEISVME